MEPLGRFYTSTFVSNLLVSRFRQTSPGTVLELGVGSGSLLQAAYEQGAVDMAQSTGKRLCSE